MATTPAANARVPSSSAEIAAAVPIAGEPFLWEGAFPCAARIRAAKAKHRAYAAQQSIEQSPVDAQKIRVAAARAPHAFPVSERQGAIGWRIRWKRLRHGERLFDSS
jgi:hypothetical protein